MRMKTSYKDRTELRIYLIKLLREMTGVYALSGNYNNEGISNFKKQAEMARQLFHEQSGSVLGWNSKSLSSAGGGLCDGEEGSSGC